MIALSHLWRWWTDTWRAPKRARLLYAAMALAFAALAFIALMQSDALVAILAAVGLFVTIALAVIAPRLSKMSDPPLAEQGDPWKTN